MTSPVGATKFGWMTNRAGNACMWSTLALAEGLGPHCIEYFHVGNIDIPTI